MDGYRESPAAAGLLATKAAVPARTLRLSVMAAAKAAVPALGGCGGTSEAERKPQLKRCGGCWRPSAAAKLLPKPAFSGVYDWRLAALPLLAYVYFLATL